MLTDPIIPPVNNEIALGERIVEVINDLKFLTRMDMSVLLKGYSESYKDAVQHYLNEKLKDEGKRIVRIRPGSGGCIGGMVIINLEDDPSIYVQQINERFYSQLESLQKKPSASYKTSEGEVQIFNFGTEDFKDADYSVQSITLYVRVNEKSRLFYATLNSLIGIQLQRLNDAEVEYFDSLIWETLSTVIKYDHFVNEVKRLGKILQMEPLFKATNAGGYSIITNSNARIDYLKTMLGKHPLLSILRNRIDLVSNWVSFSMSPSKFSQKILSSGKAFEATKKAFKQGEVKLIPLDTAQVIHKLKIPLNLFKERTRLLIISNGKELQLAEISTLQASAISAFDGDVILYGGTRTNGYDSIHYYFKGLVAAMKRDGIAIADGTGCVIDRFLIFPVPVWES